MKKKLIAIAMLATVAFSSFAVLTGCGGGTPVSESQPEPASSQEEVSSTLNNTEEVSSQTELVSQTEAGMTDELTAADLAGPVLVLKGGTSEFPESEFVIQPQAMANRIELAVELLGDNKVTITGTSTTEDGSVWLNDDNGNSIVVAPCEDYSASTASVMVISAFGDSTYLEAATSCIGAAVLGTNALETYDPFSITAADAAEGYVFRHGDTYTRIDYTNDQLTGFTIYPD